LEIAQSKRRDFNNYIEDWEAVVILTNNSANIEKLRAKYMHLHFYDDDEKEVYRIVNIEWHQVDPKFDRRRGLKSQYQVVCIPLHISQVDEDDVDDDASDSEYIGYVINDELHNMIRDCRVPYNDAFNLLHTV